MADGTCQKCGATYSRPPAKLGKFCTKTCAYAARTKPPDQLGGYRMVYAPGHPLVVVSPYLPEHRILLWEKIGPGQHPCHYCKRVVAWTPGAKVGAGALITDHLDRNRLNNDPANLVPCCQRCNVLNRALTVGDEENYRDTHKGTRVRGESRNCGTCGEVFIAWPDTGRPNRGRFCSRSCARRARRS